MLQQRASKYHSAVVDQYILQSGVRRQIFQAGSRRLFEEMGFKTELKELFHFIYKAPLIMV
jgi:isopentenyl-diphosphate delta-isomerase